MTELLLLLSLFVDIPLAIFFYKRAYVERSNMNKTYKWRFAFMVVIIVGTVFMWRTGHYLNFASIIAALPAISTILFLLFMSIALYRFKGPWR